MKRETERESTRFRALLLQEMRKRVPVSKQPERAAAFHVLKQTDTPSALVELGYMTNPGDMKRMRSRKWRRRIAGAIARAVTRFFDAR